MMRGMDPDTVNLRHVVAMLKHRELAEGLVNPLGGVNAG